MTTKTRLSLTIMVLVFLMITAITAVFKGMDNVAAIATTGIITSLTSYVWGELNDLLSRTDEAQGAHIFSIAQCIAAVVLLASKQASRSRANYNRVLEANEELSTKLSDNQVVNGRISTTNRCFN